MYRVQCVKFSPFWIINFVHVLYLFQVLSTVHQTRVFKEGNTIMQFIPREIGNDMLYCVAFMPEVPIQRFLSV